LFAAARKSDHIDVYICIIQGFALVLGFTEHFRACAAVPEEREHKSKDPFLHFALRAIFDFGRKRMPLFLLSHHL
jgi:hypothetical protein